MTYRVLFFLLSFFCGTYRAQAQELTAYPDSQQLIFRNIDYNNGLISNAVFSIAQDNRGFMWIGTRKGLQRYDGLRFENFIDTSTGPKNDALIVAGIYPDQGKGRVLYNQSYTHLKELDNVRHHLETRWPANTFSARAARPFADNSGRRWELQIYHVNETERVPHASSGIAIVREPGKEKPYFAFYTSDSLHRQTWVTEPGHGLTLFDETTGVVRTPQSDRTDNPIFGLMGADALFLRKILLDSRGDLWLITWSDKLYRYNTATKLLQTYPLFPIARRQGGPGQSSPWVTSALEDDHGNLWFGTGYAGLLQFHAAENSFSYITGRQGDNLSLQYSEEIFSLFQDRESNIWIGTDKGISVFNPYRNLFTAVSRPPTLPVSLSHAEITETSLSSHGELLVAYWGNGIGVFDTALNYRRNILFDSADKNYTWCLQADREGNTWVGCQHGFLYVLDAKNAVRSSSRPAVFGGSTIRCMALDHAGNIYFGLHSGKIVSWNRQEKQFYPFISGSVKNGKPLSSVYNIFFDRAGRCWASTSGGLAEFDVHRRTFTATYEPAAPLPAPCHGVLQLNDSTLLVATENAGLCRFRIDTKRFERLPLNPAQYLWSAFAVGKDDAGKIWFTTDYDICSYDPAGHAFVTYAPGEGMLNSSFQGNRFVRMPGEKWITATGTELIRFEPGSLSALQTNGSRPTITGLKLFTDALPVDSFLYAGQPVRLTYNQNFLTFEFANLEYSGVTKTRYFYRLTGVDKDWVDAGGRGQAGYTGLPPGNYRFEVTTGDPGSQNNIAAIDLSIAAPYWKTVWFRAGLLLFALLLLFFAVRWYVRNIRREADLKQQIARTEMSALRAQMNPHFIFNCINGIDALIQRDDKYQATIYLNKFAKLIRNILDSSKQNTIPLKKDLETLQLYVDLERFRSGNDFAAEIHAPEQMLPAEYKVPPLIIQPYVENAILHGLRNRPGGGGKLTITLSVQGDHLVYLIEDDGVGRAAAKGTQHKSRSYGMEMSAERLRLFNRTQDIPVVITDLEENGRPAGTRVQVTLKIK